MSVGDFWKQYRLSNYNYRFTVYIQMNAMFFEVDVLIIL